jgi:hypothetical protein
MCSKEIKTAVPVRSSIYFLLNAKYSSTIFLNFATPGRNLHKVKFTQVEYYASLGITVFGPLKADSHIACSAHAVPLPCHLLIHTRHAAPLPCSDSALSFVEVCMAAGNI